MRLGAIPSAIGGGFATSPAGLFRITGALNRVRIIVFPNISGGGGKVGPGLGNLPGSAGVIDQVELTVPPISYSIVSDQVESYGVSDQANYALCTKNPVFGFLKIRLAHRLRARVAWCMVPLAMWSGVPIASCYGSGQCQVLASYLQAGDSARATGVCSHCCCHTSGSEKGSRPDNCNCPIVGRDAAVIVTPVAAVGLSDQHSATLAAIPALMPCSAAVHLVDYREAGPPLNRTHRFDRLLI